MRLQYASPSIILLLTTVLIRNLWPLRYYISFFKKPIWKMTHEIPQQRRSNSTVLALLDSSNAEKANACLSGWLKQTDQAFVYSSCTNDKLNLSEYALFRVKSRNEWVRIRMMSWLTFLTLPLHMDWVVFAKDDTFLLIDQLKKFIKPLDVDEKHIGIVGTAKFEKSQKGVNPIYFISRGAFKEMAMRIHKNRKGCGLTDSLWKCLYDANHMNLDLDEKNKYRYMVLTRHFSPTEMKDFTQQHGSYDDGFQIIQQLSGSLLSFHNLSADDQRILNVLLNRIRLWPG